MGLSTFLKMPCCKNHLGFKGLTVQFQLFCSTLTSQCKTLVNYVMMTGLSVKINKSDGPHILRPPLA